jgi:Domain of unknown function (DUF4129)
MTIPTLAQAIFAQAMFTQAIFAQADQPVPQAIEQTSLGWQIRLASQRAGEWVELQFSKWNQPNPDVPEPPTLPEFPAWLGPLLFWLLIIGAVVLLSILILSIIDHFLAERASQGKPQWRKAPTTVPEPTLSEWLKTAQRFAQAGNWPEACRALYMAALQKLHDRKWIAHQPSRTDREYITQLLTPVTNIPQPRPYQLLITTHERAHFGQDPLSEEVYQRCRTAYQEIEKKGSS